MICYSATEQVPAHIAAINALQDDELDPALVNAAKKLAIARLNTFSGYDLVAMNFRINHSDTLHAEQFELQLSGHAKP